MRRITGLALSGVLALTLTACQLAPQVVSAQQPPTSEPVAEVDGGTGETTGSQAGTTTELRPVRSIVSDQGAGSVSVQATWLGGADGLLSFEVALTTHSVDLSRFDFASNLTLRDDTGNETPAAAWTDKNPDSHHRSGVVSFAASAIGDDSTTATLVVRDLARVPERALTFQLAR